MRAQVLTRMFEHNLWANLRIIDACLGLTDVQLDATPTSGAYGTIRQTLAHLISGEELYLQLLTLPPDSRERVDPQASEFKVNAARTGEGLLAIARGEGALPAERITIDANEAVDPWVLMVQAINHATEHREQIKSMLSGLGVAPPEIDGWGFGAAQGAYVWGQ